MKRYSTMKPDFYRTENISVSSKSKLSKPPTPDKSKGRHSTEKPTLSNRQFLRGSLANKQHNVSSDLGGSLNAIDYDPLDESAVVEVTVKTTNPPKQRSKSTVCDRKPWGQLLNKQTNLDNESVFGKCDPLRTLHFLAKELQTHMQNRLPEESNVQEIIKAMHSALKRIPPEVASTVQLQHQAIDLLPKVKRTVSRISSNENLNENKTDRMISNLQSKEFGAIQKLIEESTTKLDDRCKHLENMLQNECINSKLMENKISEMEHANKQLTSNITEKDEELFRLKSSVDVLQSKLQETTSSTTDSQLIIVELKKVKQHLEQEVLKLQHQLRLCAIEKEKYLAILAIRDRQIHEIRNEMTQLQESVNQQLVQIHNCAVGSMPGYNGVTDEQTNKEGDTISSIWPDDDKPLHPTHDIFKAGS